MLVHHLNKYIVLTVTQGAKNVVRMYLLPACCCVSVYVLRPVLYEDRPGPSVVGEKLLVHSIEITSVCTGVLHNLYQAGFESIRGPSTSRTTAECLMCERCSLFQLLLPLVSPLRRGTIGMSVCIYPWLTRL